MAESFGLDAERYDRARPGYPPAMVERIIAASPGRDVLDVGIGTGISARPFHADGCRVTGVDVDDRMAEFARRHGFEVEVASFEEWRPAWTDVRSSHCRAGLALGGPGSRRPQGGPGASAVRAAGCVLERVPVPSRSIGGHCRRIPAGSPRLAVLPRDVRGPGRVLGPSHQGGQRYTRKRAGLAPPSSGSSTGCGSTPGASGWTRSRRPVATTSSRRASWTNCWRAPAPPSTPLGAGSR